MGEPRAFGWHGAGDRGLLCSALLLMGSPVWDEDGAGPASERPGDSDLRPPCSQPQPGCLHLRQVRELYHALHPVPCCALCCAMPCAVLCRLCPWSYLSCASS